MAKNELEMTQELNEFRVSVVAESGFPSFHDVR